MPYRLRKEVSRGEVGEQLATDDGQFLEERRLFVAHLTCLVHFPWRAARSRLDGRRNRCLRRRCHPSVGEARQRPVAFGGHQSAHSPTARVVGASEAQDGLVELSPTAEQRLSDCGAIGGELKRVHKG